MDKESIIEYLYTLIMTSLFLYFYWLGNAEMMEALFTIGVSIFAFRVYLATEIKERNFCVE